jgi:putative ABC transport system permease protein
MNRDEISDGMGHGDIRFIWLLGSIATFILIIACINFINLSTARSANRAKEVGLRKVVGSLRSSLIHQFLIESLVFSFFSFALGLLIAWLMLPYFNFLLAKSLIFPWKEWWLLPVLTTGALITGILAGIYPAFYLSSFKPVQVLKGNVSRGSKNSATRSMLVVFQFTVSIILMVGTFIINRQMNYILTKKIGYDKDQVLLIQGAHTLKEKIISFKGELLRVPGITNASISGFLPIMGTSRNSSPLWTEGGNEAQSVRGQQWRVDHDYVKTMGLNILEGRDFSFEINSDSQAVVINSTLAKKLNLEKPVGQRITNGRRTWEVIGVIEDFHFQSLKENIEPLSLMIGESSNTVSVKINTADMPGMIRAVSKVWKEFSLSPVRYTFLDQSYARMYDDVDRMGRIFSSFAVLAIIVASLGLFALSAFMAEQRSKEVSIRLVLGASVQSIFRLLTLNFLKLVMISLIIAIPISLVMMQEWLKDFAYKVEIGWEIFLLAGLLAALIALATISYQSIRAALMNPVENLKSE